VIKEWRKEHKGMACRVGDGYDRFGDEACMVRARTLMDALQL